MPSIAFGQTDAWNGGSDNWSNASNWSSGVPSATSNVFIDNGKAVASPVTLDINGAANTLTVDSDDSLSFNNGVTLSMSGNISNAGKINMNGTNTNTQLIVVNAGSAGVTLTGGGTLTSPTAPAA